MNQTSFCCRYFTDILNMLQGFYIFLIFVCKRNVYTAIMIIIGRKAANYQDKTNTTKFSMTVFRNPGGGRSATENSISASDYKPCPVVLDNAEN